MSDASSSGSRVRSAFRILAGLFIVALGISGAVLTIAATGGLSLGPWLIGIVILMAGFASLDITRVVSAPLRPVKIALIISVVLASCMLLALPWPPGRLERASFVTLTLGIAFSLGAYVVVIRSPRSAIILLALLGGYGIYMLARVGLAVGSGADTMAWIPPKPAMTFSFVLAESLATAWIAACWHARTLWPAIRRLRDHAA